MFTDVEKKILLKIARKSIESIITKEKFSNSDFPVSPALNFQCGAFVTLHLDSQLRGCIGQISSNEPITDLVIRMAIAAAKEDPRFAPVSRDEVKFLHIEISALSPMEKVNTYDEIEIGKHGLLVEEPNGRGLLLPQVATENNFNLEQFLTAVCRKSGLNGNLWKSKQIKLKKFSAIVFDESLLKEI